MTKTTQPINTFAALVASKPTDRLRIAPDGTITKEVPSPPHYVSVEAIGGEMPVRLSFQIRCF